MEHGGYPVHPLRTDPGVIIESTSVFTSRSTSTSTTSQYTTSHSSTKQKPGTDTGQKSSISTRTSTFPAAINTPGFTFLQLHGILHSVSEGNFRNADFSQLCTSGNCFTDCENLTRVFTANPAAFSNSTDMDAERAPVTLFGICSNLVNATASVELSDDTGLKSYFRSTADAENDIGLIASNLTMCLVDTCDSTRNSSECNQYCQMDNLLQPQHTLAIHPGLFECAYQLCQSTCGLPYANQDVVGIGVRFITPHRLRNFRKG